MAPVAPPTESIAAGPVDGKVFVFAGRLAALSRREAMALVRMRGGATRRHVSRHTSFLVVGDADRGQASRGTRKVHHARRLGASGRTIQIISEGDFLRLLGLESAWQLRVRYYSSRDVQRLYGFDRTTLRTLESMTLISPILRTNAERYYTFSDLLLFRRIHEAIDRGGTLGRIVARLLQARAGQLPLPLDGTEPEILAIGHAGEVDWTAHEWYNLGCDYDDESSASDDAADAYRRALDLDPYHVGALINLGNLCYDLGNIDEARRLYERALASDPDNAIAHFNLGNVYDDLGEYDNAIRYFGTAIRLRPGNADAHFNLGLVYDRLGEVSMVRRHMRFYLRLNPEGDMADVAREYLQLTEERPDADDHA